MANVNAAKWNTVSITTDSTPRRGPVALTRVTGHFTHHCADFITQVKIDCVIAV